MHVTVRPAYGNTDNTLESEMPMLTESQVASVNK